MRLRSLPFFIVIIGCFYAALAADRCVCSRALYQPALIHRLGDPPSLVHGFLEQVAERRVFYQIIDPLSDVVRHILQGGVVRGVMRTRFPLNTK